MERFDERSIEKMSIKDAVERVKEKYIKLSNSNEDSKLIDAFNSRYYEALKNGKMDMALFLKAEVGAINDIKYARQKAVEDKIREEKEKEIIANTKSEVDAFIKGHSDMIKKFPYEKLFDEATEEASRLYGAFIELYVCFSQCRTIISQINDPTLSASINDVDIKFTNYVVRRGSELPIVFQDYKAAVEKIKKTTDRHKPEQELLKESGVFLNFVKVFFSSNVMTEIKFIEDVKFNLPKDIAQNSPRVYKTLSGKTKREVIKLTIKYIETIIKDFRLQNFKR